MEAIKRDLERKRKAITSALQSSMALSRGGGERNELFKDPYGSASQTHDDEITADMVSRRATELRQVDRALADIEAGRYGLCQECGEQIAVARLKALPFATRCVACQSAIESNRQAA